MREIRDRKTGETLRWDGVTWDELTPAQQEEVLHGEACGHPSNRPKDEAEARRWRYTLTPDKGVIRGIEIGFFGTDGRYHSR